MFTVLGADGFVGRSIVSRLASEGREYLAVGRRDPLPQGPLGHVIYAIGVTADFRARPLDTMDAHITEVVRMLRESRFDSLLYLSSTRVYSGSLSTNEESALIVAPALPDNLYNASKIAGESVCLGHRGPGVARVARLSNVYGVDVHSPNFLSDVVRSSIENGAVELRTSLSSEKDYVSIDAVVAALLTIASSGQHRLYNVASGSNISNAQIAEELKQCVGCSIAVSANAEEFRFPVIDVSRLTAEVGRLQCDVLADMRKLVSAFRTESEKA